MSKRVDHHHATGRLQVVPGYGVLHAYGQGAPTASAAGFAKGCLYQDTTNGDLYINTGSVTTATWAQIGAAGETLATLTVTTLTSGTIAEVTAASGVTIDTAVIRDGNFHGVQGAPTAETGVATITIADMLTGIVTISHTTGATVALTVDTGSAMDTGMPASFGVGSYIDYSIINISAAAADTATLTAAANHTLVGIPIIQSAHTSTGDLYGNAGRFRARRTAANTWITYRIS